MVKIIKLKQETFQRFLEIIFFQNLIMFQYTIPKTRIKKADLANHLQSLNRTFVCMLIPTRTKQSFNLNERTILNVSSNANMEEK